VRRSCAIIALLALLILPVQSLAYQAAIQASASRADVGKGETFTYKLSVIEEGEAAQPVQLVPPDFTGFDVHGTFSSTSVKVIENKARRVNDQEYRISSSVPGEHVIPPAKLVLTDPKTGKEQVITSEPVKVTVLEKGPGLLKGLEEDIRDIKSPKTFPEKMRAFFLVMMALVVLVFFMLLGLAIYMVKRKKKGPPVKGGAPGQASLAPRDEALEKLRRAESLMENTKAYYSAVSDAVREYLKAAYGIHAPELTTSEIMDGMKKAAVRDADRDSLRSILADADLVKFAKHSPDDSEKRRFMDRAKALVSNL
jgi:hypothetical protein